MSTWVITTKGQVRRIDKLLKNEKYNDTVYGVANHFTDKEAAFTARDNIIDFYPRAFLGLQSESANNADDNLCHGQPEHSECTRQDNVPEQSPRPKNKTKKDITQEEWRNITRTQVMKHYDTFWNEWSKLRPKDKCDLYLKMVQYAFAHAPAEKPLDQDDLQKIEERKLLEKEQAIAAGIPENDDFDE